MKTTRAVELAGGKAKLAQLLGITPGAVSQWGEDLPPSRVWQLQLLRREWFGHGDESSIVANETDHGGKGGLVHD